MCFLIRSIESLSSHRTYFNQFTLLNQFNLQRNSLYYFVSGTEQSKWKMKSK